MTEVRTRDEAIASVDRALQVWSTDVTGLLSQATSQAGAARDEAERVVRGCANKVAVVEALLSAAGEDQRRRLQAELIRAKEAYDQAKRANVRVQDVAASVGQLSRAHTTGAIAMVASARVKLSAMSQALEGYRLGGVVPGVGAIGGGGPSAKGVGGGSLASMGLAELDVSAADLDENPILDGDRSREAFGKGGLSRADYRWAVQTWNDTVGPGVASGKTREQFADRDERSSAKPLRRTADVYDLFAGTDRIRVDRRADGSLNVINGRHRLLIARELGIKTLPGEVS